MAGIIDPLRDVWNSLVKFDEDKAKIDSVVAKLHHRVNYFLMFAGVIASLASSFLFSDQIVCHDGTTDYDKNFCLVHGAEHVKTASGDLVAGGVQCWGSGQEYKTFREEWYGDRRPTDYYIWLPYALVICMGLSKLARMIWKMLEGGIMAEVKRDNGSTARMFQKMKEKKTFFLDSITIYYLKYFFIEVLSVIFLVVSIGVVNSLLHHQFINYWPSISHYESLSHDFKRKLGEPKCKLFPTEVDCSVSTGGSTGGDDTGSKICSLPANLFNQYFFVIIWFWWVILFAISLINLLFRMITYIIPNFGKTILVARLGQRGVFIKEYIGNLNTCDCFFLDRVAQNMKREEFSRVLMEIANSGEDLDYDREALMDTTGNDTELTALKATEANHNPV